MSFKEFLQEQKIPSNKILNEKDIKSYFNNDKYMSVVFNLETLKIVEEKYYKDIGNISLVFHKTPFNDRDDLELAFIFDCYGDDAEIEFKDNIWFEMLDDCIEYFNNGLTKKIQSKKNFSNRTPLSKGNWSEVEDKYSRAILIYDLDQFKSSIREYGKHDYKNMSVSDVGFEDEIWISGVNIYDLLMPDMVESIFERGLETLIDDW